jgi:hypothetical protein
MISTVWLHKNFKEDLIMSFTNKTPNYNLPQWLGTDKPSWLVDVNGAFSSIDTAIKNASDSGSSADATAKAALETAQSAQETANGALEQADNANTKADNANVTAGNAQAAAGEALGKVNAIANVNKWKKYVGTITDVTINPGLTKRIDPIDPAPSLVTFYNETLKLMQISSYVPVTATADSPSTLTNGYAISGYKGYWVPILKLPFNCTGKLIVPYWMYRGNYNTGAEKNPYVSNSMNTVVIAPYNGSAWLHSFTSSNPDNYSYAWAEVGGLPGWLNVASLGTITLEGWTDIN